MAAAEVPSADDSPLARRLVAVLRKAAAAEAEPPGKWRDLTAAMQGVPRALHDRLLPTFAGAAAGTDDAIIAQVLWVSFAGAEPLHAAAQLDLFADAELRAWAQYYLVLSWSRLDADGALTWLQEKGGGASPDFRRHVARELVLRHPAAVGVWIRDLPVDADLEALIAQAVRALNDRELEREPTGGGRRTTTLERWQQAWRQERVRRDAAAAGGPEPEQRGHATSGHSQP